MPDRYDIHLRRIEIAWEIAKQRLASTNVYRESSEDYEAALKRELRTVWRIVSDTFPTRLSDD